MELFHRPELSDRSDGVGQPGWRAFGARARIQGPVTTSPALPEHFMKIDEVVHISPIATFGELLKKDLNTEE